jgi:hypothetical protein
MIPIIDSAIALLKDALDRFIPDKTQAAQAKAALDQLNASNEAQQYLAAADIVKTEAASESWLTRSWRPITMIWLLVLISCHLFGLTDVAHVSEVQYDFMWKLLEIGIGGYTISRSVEKVAPSIANAIQGKN